MVTEERGGQSSQCLAGRKKDSGGGGDKRYGDLSPPFSSPDGELLFLGICAFYLYLYIFKVIGRISFIL